MPTKAKELKPVEVNRLTKPGLHAVGGVAGLHLQVKESGARSWILRVQVGARRPDIGLGGYPDVTLEQARNAREIKAGIKDGIDPIAARRAKRDALRLAVARQLTFDEAASFTHKTSVRQRIESVLAWATVNKYRTGDNPARWKGNLEHALRKPSKVRKVDHHAAIPWAEVPTFMADLRKREGIGARALEFAILTAARSGEVRFATWDEIDVEAKLWAVPAERMKARKIHRVPLSDPALKLLEAVPRVEGSNYVFTAVRGGVVSDMTISAVCRRMGVAAVPHGFRSSFKDWCRSWTAYADEVSQLALAHISSDATRAAYARDELLPKRVRLMRDWAKFCATVPKKAGVTHIGSRRHG